ncbi:amino acid adenylation domain-containing protein, partial [Corallococcus exiguus]|nr:amino acid adenylation domain-containing protein [Corallococcus exiguus]
DLTAERFIPHPFATLPGERVYRTGDRVRWRADGSLEFLGRIDTQVKVRGYRIELSEVEAALRDWPALTDAAVLVREDVPGDKRLVAYVVAGALDVQALREHLRQRLPEYMLPAAFVPLPVLPLTASGKLDRKTLPAPDVAASARKGRFVEPADPLEEQLAAIWARELGARSVGVHDHFFEDLGGTSLTVVRVASRLHEALQRDVPVVWLFEHPTVHGLARRLEREGLPARPVPTPDPTSVLTPSASPAGPSMPAPSAPVSAPEKTAALPSNAIAIVGMSGRFPGAESVEEFWRNLREGVESISRFTPEELEPMPGLPPGVSLTQHPGFVPAQGVLSDIDQFDPAFFDMSLREAQWTDPQQRMFLQCAWAALEDAGIDPARFPGVISLFAGANESGYANEVQRHLPLDSAAFFELYGTATYQSLPTKVSYKLGLTGESMLVYTACSTGLVAVHVACQNLLSGLSDVALAGATRLSVPQRTGYVHQEGMIYSPDGHCRAFDAKGKGTVSGSGVAAVVLKRLEDAVRDGDPIHAVIRATAVNNDGRDKSGFTAPSVQGQATVITQALRRSGVTATDIGYVEAHGTATPLGDPIEVAALQRAYGLGPEHRGTIPLASLKTNVGHLDTVAGLAGLIKVALSLREEEIPPSLHFESPNPRIDFDAGPFFVNTRLRPWPRRKTPRRAAVSSFGVGGTNAHAVLEEAPVVRSGPTTRSHQLFVLSARSPESLEAGALALASHVLADRSPEALEAVSLKLADQVLSARSPEALEAAAKQLALRVLLARSPESLEALSARFAVEAVGAGGAFADAAYTQAVGRRAFEYRRAVVARDAADLAKQLRKTATPTRLKDVEGARRKRVAFVFSGQGSQQVGMGRELDASVPAFRAQVDACLALLDVPLRSRVETLLLPGPGQEAEASAMLSDTRVALPALFTVQVALARLWQAWGIVPHAVLGHSFGEYAAACVAGVLSLPDALRLAVVRGELMHRLPPGAMLGVALPAAEVQPLLSGRLTLAAINAPDRCVVSGPVDEVERIQAVLQQRKAGAVRMPSGHAFHSADVEPLMAELARAVGALQRNEPSVRYVSSLTGALARPSELAAPEYWATQMRQPVRFTDAVGALLEEGCSVLLEVGPGQDLTPLIRACLGEDRERVKALASLRRGGATTEQSGLLQCVGELWMQGLELDWTAFYAHEQRRRVHLPTYRFLRKRCWVGPRGQDGAAVEAGAAGQDVTPAPGVTASAPRTNAVGGLPPGSAPLVRTHATAGQSDTSAMALPTQAQVTASTGTITSSPASRAPSTSTHADTLASSPASLAPPTSAHTGTLASSQVSRAHVDMPGLSSAAPTSTSSAVAPPTEERPALPVPGAREDAPRGDVEVRVATLWRQRLGLDFVGRDDNFLELGGNSLMAAQLLNQLRDTFHVQVPLAALFEAPTVAGLAARIEPLLQQAPAREPTRELPLVPRSRTEPLPLSFVQERVWRLEQHLPGLSAYTIPFVLRLEGPADAAILERAIQEVVQRHEALRTTYDAVDGRPVQRFHPHVRIPLPIVEVEGSPGEREEAALRIAREDAARPFDLVRGPVLRTTLVRLRADLHLLVCAIHHIVCDTLSTSLFLQEVGQLYAAFLQGRPSPLAPLPVQYADFGAWQRQSLAEAHFPEQEQWWRQRLAGMPKQLGIPTDRPLPASCPLTSERMVLDFPPELAEALVAFGRNEGFTSYMTVLAAWNALLHRYTGQADLIVGTPIGNRTRPALLPLIGYVAHSAAFRTHVGDDPSFRELLHRVRHEVTDVQSRPDVPFEMLVEQLVPGRDVGRERMTDTVFVYHSNLEMGGDALAAVGAKGTFIEVPGTPVQWGATLSDLTLILTEEPGRIHGALEYATELFDASTARRILRHLQVLLGAALARPEQALSRLPLATDAERSAWPIPPPVTQAPVLPARLREHALRQPDAVAVEQAGRTWTWRELASRARKLASRLREQGLRPGEPVALCLRASPEKLAALWGVLEAGGAPVALGPTDLDSLAVYAVEGSVVPRLITWRGLFTSTRLESSRVLHVEEVLGDASPLTVTEALPLPSPESLAWLLPMGAGQPAWALSHTSLTGFFAGLDARLRPAPGTTWLAASEPAPEKPELEALWALSRGLRVLFPSEATTSRRGSSDEAASRPLQLSLSYFANDEDSLTGPKYELLMEGAKFADANGFSAIWTPERHFHSFGGIYPQPAVVSAALASVTKHLRLRSGSVVLPLHDPLLIAEQWAVVDNLSQGRVDVSVATGWHVQDFIFAPGNYADRRNILLRHLETLRGLWRGERLRRPGGNGVTVEVGLRPKPVQRELPVWLTATANPETFRLAGELGAGVLTGLFAHSLEELKPKVSLYREAWRRNGHPGRGHITCMLHTYLGDDEAEVLRQVRKPLLAYFRSSADITTSLLAAQGYQGEIAKVSREDIDALLEHTFEHHAKGTGLIGTVESGIQRLREVRASDVDEVTCLIDFGLETPVVLEGLKRLATVREAVAADAASHSRRVRGEQETDAEELLSLAKQSGAVLVNTTARLARALTDLPGAREALAPVGAWVLENASAELAAAVQRTAGGDVLLAGEARDGGLLPRAPEEKLPPGLDVWVLDAAGAPVPAGVVGELALSGAGLPAALWRATGEAPGRLVPHPRSGSTCLYRTGRPVRLRADGRVEAVNLPAFKLPAPRPASPAAPSALAATMHAETPSAPGALQTIPRAPRDRPLPLSFAQQRLWYLQELEPESTAYNNAIIFRLTGALDVTALQTALHSLVERHEVLRTTYALSDTGAVQVVHATGTLPLETEDVPGDTADAREAAMLRRCQAYTATPFRLTTGPVARALLLRLAPDTHVLHLLLHHVVSDAWCALVLSRELPVLYACASAGVPSVLPPLPVQYADYAVWQRAWLTGPVLDEQARWWKELLQATPPLELPTDRPRPAAQSYAGAAHAFHLPRELSEPLLALGRREGATSFMVLMALFQVLLSRTSGQDDFAVGTPIAGRSRPEVEGLLGCFVNTLAFRARLDGAPGFRELITHVKKQALGGYARQDMPFEQLVDVLQVPRDLSRTPVFQTVLNVINVPEAQTTGGAGLQIGGVDVPVTTSKFELSLEVWEQRDGLRCRLEYSTALFDAATLERMAEHLTVLAKAVVATPDAPVSTLSLLTPAAREQVLRGWNDTRVDFPAGATVHHLFESQVERTPEAIALQFEDRRLTYAQLEARANQLAHHLRAHGVGPETLVGVCMERSLEMVVALLGVLKAGAAYVPLDPATPAERLAGMLEDTAAPVLLVQERFRAALPLNTARDAQEVASTVLPSHDKHVIARDAQGNVRTALPSRTSHVIALDTQWEAIARESMDRPVPLAGDDALAYVIFTSGSTGRPKGAMNAHAGVVNRLRWMQGRYGLTPSDTVLQKTPFSFDVSVWEFFWPLMTGARLVLARPGGHQEPDYLVALMAREGVTTTHFVSSMLRAFVEEPGLESLTRLRQLMCSGEALPADLVLRAQSRLPRTTLHNLYGPTEAAVDVTSWECPRDEALRVVPIGRPVANTRMHVLDRHGQPVPVGIPGELFIGGVQVGRGYWRRPTLTAERFIPDAFSDTPGARVYRTGDIARWSTDGTLEYLGRADFQVKLRGFRIELGDIEVAIQSWPGVRDTVAVVRHEGTGGPRLVAYVSVEGPLDVAGLRTFLHSRLPEYMVPSAIVRMDALPLTSSGKVNRKALPAPDAPIAGRAEPVAPRDDTERALAEIFAQVLGIARVGVRDSFFELGGHSLLATQVAARVRTRLGQEVPLRTLFEAPTVEALARRISSSGAVAPAPAEPEKTEPTGLTPLTRGVRPAVLPLSFAQQRLWFIHQLGTADTAYNMPFSLRLEGTLDLGALQRSFDRLVRRHEVLRTTFREYEGAPEQVIHAPGPLPLRHVDLTGTPDLEQRRAEATRLALEEARTPFDLEQGPLLRALLLKLSPTEHVLVLNLHHIISDGWSTGVLVREMGTLYAALSRNLPSPLPELPVQYADHALWQRGWLHGAVLDAQLGYWRRQLEGAPSHLELPTDHPRPARRTFQGALMPFTFTRASSEALEALAKREGATPYMVLLAAFQVLLGRYAGQDDVLVGSPIAGRRHAESEALIGYFANTVVLRTRLREDDTFVSLLTRVRDTTLGAYEHQDLPFEKLVDALHPVRDTSRTPFFQITFTLQNAPLPPLALPGLSFQPMNADPGAIRFDLELLLHRAPEGFTGGLNFNTALFTPGTVAGMARHLSVLLEAAVASPRTPLTRLSLLTPEERHQVLVSWNDTATEYPRDASVPELFADQAARTPNAVAVRVPASPGAFPSVDTTRIAARELTYGELDRRSNQLAHHLRRLGVRPGDRVGLCVERSPELVTGMLGILKAGAAYVPVEAKAPADRTAWVLQEAGISVLVTQEALADELPVVTGLLVLLDEEADLIAKQPAAPLDVRVSAEALAYVMFTSGSTGRPKGVCVPHRGIVRLVRGNGFIAFGPEQVFLQAAPVAFDASTLELWGALLHGAKLVLAPPHALSLSELGTLLAVEGVTTLWLTAALFEQMVLHEGVSLAGVRQVLAGGDVLPVPRVREHLSRMAPDAVLVNGYGPTENTTFSTTHTLRAGDTVERSVPIGRPLTNSTAWVLDAHLQPLPPGLPGELYVGGDGLAWGYLQRPDLTAERFIPHPHSATPGARLYRTGDRARWRDDGTLEFLGRTDFQLKLRGFRIEPGEVEAVLRQAPDVHEAVVLAREDVPGEKRLVAYVVLGGDSADTDRVKAHAQRQLPDYMVPSAWVALQSLPLSPNGKVDRKALPAPEAPQPTESTSEAPRNA